MFDNIRKLWKEHDFEICIIASLLILLVMSVIYGNRKFPHYTTNIRIKEKKDSKESSGERECRSALESIFGKKFNKIRPDFLRNTVTDGNNNLELDCFCPELKLAVEYNGAQHYKFIPYFHKNKETFLNQKYRDELKRRMCTDNGITLIEVPYTVSVSDIKMFLVAKLRDHGFLK